MRNANLTCSQCRQYFDDNDDIYTTNCGLLCHEGCMSRQQIGYKLNFNNHSDVDKKLQNILETKIKDLENQLTESKMIQNWLQKQVISLNKQIDTLNAELANKNANVQLQEQLNNEIQSLKAELDSKNAKIELQDQLNAISGQLNNLQENQITKSLHSSLMERIGELVEKSDNMQFQQQLLAEFQELKEAADTAWANNNVQKQMTDLNLKYDDLKKIINVKNFNNVDLQQQIVAINDQLKGLNTELVTKTLHRNLSQQVETLRNELAVKAVNIEVNLASKINKLTIAFLENCKEHEARQTAAIADKNYDKETRSVSILHYEEPTYMARNNFTPIMKVILEYCKHLGIGFITEKDITNIHYYASGSSNYTKLTVEFKTKSLRDNFFYYGNKNIQSINYKMQHLTIVDYMPDEKYDICAYALYNYERPLAYWNKKLYLYKEIVSKNKLSSALSSSLHYF